MRDELVLKVAALKVVSDYTKTRYDESRAEVAEMMERGDRKMCRSPLGDVKIAAVSMSDPKAVALISDEAAYTEWVRQTYPDAIESAFHIIGSDAEVVAVLFEYAPHLIRRTEKVDPEFTSAVRRESAALGDPIGPGGEADIPGVKVSTPNPVVSCKPTEDALAAVVDLFRAERMTLESLVRPELPGGAA